VPKSGSCGGGPFPGDYGDAAPPKLQTRENMLLDLARSSPTASIPSTEERARELLERAKIFAIEQRGAGGHHVAANLVAELVNALETALSPPIHDERLRKALEPFLPAYEAYVAVMQNFSITGNSSAERRFSEGEREDTAKEAAHEALASITFDQLHAVHEVLSDVNDEEAKLVQRFAAALLAKLRASEAKYGWQRAWMKEDWREELSPLLLKHVGKGDPVDVAAYAAFAWHHGWTLTLPARDCDPPEHVIRAIDAAIHEHWPNARKMAVGVYAAVRAAEVLGAVSDKPEGEALSLFNDVRGVLRSLRPAHERGKADKRLNAAITLVLSSLPTDRGGRE
jgi:hypothetical protein